MSEIKLKSCPFCGGKNVIETYNNFVPVLLCSGCGAMMTIPIASYSTSYKKNLIKKWNTRKPMQEIVERLKEESFWTEPTFDEDGYCNDDSWEAVYLDEAIEIVKEVGGMNE